MFQDEIKNVLIAARIKQIRFSDSVQAALDLIFGQYSPAASPNNIRLEIAAKPDLHSNSDCHQPNGSITWFFPGSSSQWCWF